MLMRNNERVAYHTVLIISAIIAVIALGITILRLGEYREAEILLLLVALVFVPGSAFLFATIALSLVWLFSEKPHIPIMLRAFGITVLAGSVSFLAGIDVYTFIKYKSTLLLTNLALGYSGYVADVITILLMQSGLWFIGYTIIAFAITFCILQKGTTGMRAFCYFSVLGFFLPVIGGSIASSSLFQSDAWQQYSEQQSKETMRAIEEQSALWQQAINTGNESLCHSIKDRSAINSCLLNVGLKNNDFAICERLPIPETKETCYQRFAEQSANLTLCNQVTNRDDCIVGVAFKAGNPEFCEFIDNEAKREGCRNEAIRGQTI
jgi:hypothetical protein